MSDDIKIETSDKGWNHPVSNSIVPTSKSSPVCRWMIVCIFFVSVISIIIWMTLRNETIYESEKVVEIKSLAIPETMKAAPPKVVEDIEQREVQPKELPRQKVGETRNGFIKLPSGRLHKVKGVITNNVNSTRSKAKYEIFNYHCENEIACLLMVEPGQTLVGTPHYGGRFKREFLESLKTPISSSSADSPEDAALKHAVNETKIELKAALDRGEDIEKIMLDTRKELQNLYRYKMEIRQELSAFRNKEGVTEADVEDFVGACNRMLEAKGIAPLKLGPISRQKLKLNNKEDNL